MSSITNLGRNTRALRKLHGWTLKDLADRSGLNFANLSQLENGKIGYSVDAVKKLCEAFGVSEGVLFADAEPEKGHMADFRAIPLLHSSQILKWIKSSDEERDDSEIRRIAVDRSVPADSFAFYGGVEAVSPQFSEADYIIIQKQLKPRPGDFVLAIRSRNEVVFRQFRVTGNMPDGGVEYELLPLDVFHPVIRSSDPDVMLIGTMVEHRKSRRA